MEESTTTTSTRKSRRYTINTSVIKDNINNNITDFSDTIEFDSLKALIHKITFDVGRCDYKAKWMSVLSLAVSMIFLILTSVGTNLFRALKNGSQNYIVLIIQYITEIVPNSKDVLVLLLVNLFLTFLYFAYVIFYVFTLTRYKNNQYPSTMNVHVWIFLTRCISPLFTCYFSFLLWKGLRLMLSDATKQTKYYHFVFGIILCIVHFITLHLSDTIWQTTPIIRKHDIAQLWFPYSNFNFLVQVIICIFVFGGQVGIIVSGMIGAIVFIGIVLLICTLVLFSLIRNLPFFNPSVCAFYITIFLECFALSINPLLSHFMNSNITFVFVIDVIAFIVFYFITRWIVARRSQSVVNVFKNLYFDPEQEEEDQKELYALVAEQKPKKQIDYAILGIKRPYMASLMMRIGFLYQVEDITSLDFIKYALGEFTDPNIYFSAAQIVYSLQTNLIYIGEVQKACAAISSIRNSHTFVQLMNELRQELLAQLNKPLLDGLHVAKKSNLTLQSVIGDFWGAVLKQKLEVMGDTLSMITNGRDKADNAYQRMVRDFPNSPIVLRETTAFYHKTMGDHAKAMDCHKLSKKSSKHDEDNSQSTQTTDGTFSNTNNANIDKAFAARLEPSISAQEVFNNMPSGPSKSLTVVFILTFILLIICPIIVLAMGVIDMNSFTKTFEPVKVFSDALYAITRIPQIIRRYNLYMNDQIIPWTAEVGPVRGTNLEFIPPSNCIPALKKYVDQLRDLSVSMLSIAKGNSEIERLLSSKMFDKKNGNSSIKSSSYDILVSYTNYAEQLVNVSNETWKTANTSEEVQFIFYNVDELFKATKNIMTVTNLNVIKRKDEFELKAIILHVVTWTIPIFFILPFLFIVIHNMKQEINFILKLFFAFPKNEISALRWSMKSSSAKKTKAQPQNNNPVQKSSFQTSITQSIGNSSEQNTFNDRSEGGDQIIDTLATTSRSHKGMYTDLIKTILFFAAFSCALTSIGIAIYKSAMIDILNVSYGYVMATDSTATAVASYVWGQETFSRAPMNGLSLAEAKNKTWYYVNSITNTFDSFLYTSDDGMKASLLLGDAVINAYVTSSAINSVSDKYSPQHGFLHSVYYSLSCDTQLRLLWETSFFIMNSSDPTEYTFDKDNFTYQYEHLIFSHLDYCLIAGQNLLSEQTESLEQTHLYQMLLLFCSLFALQILFYFTFALSAFLTGRSHHHTVHSLLLLVPPEALLKNQMVLKWISGSVDYSSYNRLRDTIKAKESNNISHDFIVNNSKSGLILTDAELKITQTNTTVCTMLKLEQSELNGQNFINVLNQQLNDKDKHTLLHNLEHDVQKMKAGRSRVKSTTIQSSILDKSNQMMYLTLIVVGHSSDEGGSDDENAEHAPCTSFSIVVVDSTAEHFQAALVASEKAKGEKLIESLLPPSIIKRMNEGETDITFEVQQATVLFTSIVGWSNLTQDMKATQVMSILNSLFVAYDEELHNYPAITKMKTIGHIYMCCGGLFSDSSVNSGQVVVEYAVKLLEIAQRVSKEIGISFQITCGVNTGGPIKCGILGVTRPVFDIIGDVVNVSSRMNLHCLPGYVQISPTTYEAIKYLNFNVKERGEIQVKGKGMMKTYVVSSSNNMNNGQGGSMSSIPPSTTTQTTTK